MVGTIEKVKQLQTKFDDLKARLNSYYEDNHTDQYVGNLDLHFGGTKASANFKGV